MSIVLWTLQALLALHTAIGAGWKLFNPAQSIATLSAVPSGLWLVLIPLELACAVALLAPAIAPSLAYIVPLAAFAIAVEMLAFCAIHLRSGAAEPGPVYYWLGVAAICAVIAAGRLFVAPLQS
ncbi:MAG: hypothetical protein JJU15_01815 [Pararhodobacter sp.]|nr:hypothetical protein [Pararhodobacter sp.]